MKIVVIGGSGLIGTKLVSNLRNKGHEVVAAAPSSGVNTLTGEGLDAALAGAAVVVDVANSPSFEDKAVLDFFEISGRNLLAAEKKAGVKHHVALSIVGTDRLPESGYFRAKLAQERLITGGGIPYTIVRATQFFEFLGGIAEAGARGEEILLPDALLQPVAADDVAALLAEIALLAPRNGIVELAGPEAAPIADFVGRQMSHRADPRRVRADAAATYFGAPLAQRSLVPLDDTARIGALRLADWLGRETGR
ncbi:SDR family oxidoreductase [Dongia sp.]|uniref:SDR family oxidoreductase n=1 Tax=Dongia sp. TaxID=1977262 RepID=UPI0035AF0479